MKNSDDNNVEDHDENDWNDLYEEYKSEHFGFKSSLSNLWFLISEFKISLIVLYIKLRI